MPLNACQARAYAKVAQGFLRDCADAGLFNPVQPLYFLSIGSRAAGFGYSIYRNLSADPSFVAGERARLVLVDPDESQRKRWRENIRLRPLIEAGLCFLSDLDIASDGELRWEPSKAPLPREAGKSNAFVVATTPEVYLDALLRVCGEPLLVLFRAVEHPEILEAWAHEHGGTWMGYGGCGAIWLLPGVDTKETRAAFAEALPDFDQHDPEALGETVTLPRYLALLRLSNYDAAMACRHADSVAPLIEESADEVSAGIKPQLLAALRKVWESYYPATGDGEVDEDVPLALAWLAVGLKDREFTFELLHASLMLHGESAQRSFLIALSHFRNDDFQSLDFAAQSVEAALRSEPDDETYISLRDGIAEKRRKLIAERYDSLLDEIVNKDPSDARYRETAQLLDGFIAPKGYPAPDKDPGPKKRLTIGMSTYDDYDGVYFSVMAIRLFHPEVTDRTEILVIDNQPEGPAAGPLRDLGNWVKSYRYVRAPRPGGTASRDLVFRYSDADFVLCMDSHVFFEAGSLAALLDYFEAHPDSRDLLQGPLLYDDLTNTSTHWDLNWRDGMWGTWASDPRGADRSAPPFEIPAQGLGVFACRREAWPGFNPRFRGFGGEEGYIHEKFRKAGAVVLCLPFLRWVHRFGRPAGAGYRPSFGDRIRNYLVGFLELGLDSGPAIRHFAEFLGVAEAREQVSAALEEIENPFDFFDAIYYINLDGRQDRRAHALEQCRKVGIAERAMRFPAVETPHNHHVGCALSHRAVIAEAKRRGLRNVLILEDDVVFAPDTLEVLRKSLAELQRLKNPWHLLYLGGVRQRSHFDKAPGCQNLEIAWVTSTHACTVSQTAYDTVLRDMPDSPTAMALWLRELWYGFDWYTMDRFAGSTLIICPVIASQLCLLPDETRSFEWEAVKE